MVENRIRVGTEEVMINRYEIVMGYDCVVHAGRIEAMRLADLTRNVRPAGVEFLEDGLVAATASLVFRQEHLETDQEGSRGVLAFFVVNYLPVL